jgi:hypothetical protein
MCLNNYQTCRLFSLFSETLKGENSTEIISNKEGKMNAGTIAGITIGVILAVVVNAVVIVVVVKKMRQACNGRTTLFK